MNVPTVSPPLMTAAADDIGMHVVKLSTDTWKVPVHAPALVCAVSELVVIAVLNVTWMSVFGSTAVAELAVGTFAKNLARGGEGLGYGSIAEALARVVKYRVQFRRGQAQKLTQARPIARAPARKTRESGGMLAGTR